MGFGGTRGLVARPIGTVTRPGDSRFGFAGGFIFNPSAPRPLRFGTRCFNGFCGNFFVHHPGHFGFGRFGFGNFGFGQFGFGTGTWGAGYGGYGYGYGYPYLADSGYSNSGAEADQQIAAQLDDQQRHIAELDMELRNERQRAADREVPAAAPAPPPREPDGPGTVLVFRDGSRTEVQSYAILGDTLYEVAARFTKRVPLSTLDVPATIKVNNDRGVEFAMPAKAVKGG
jgi:hypothetical protein